MCIRDSTMSEGHVRAMLLVGEDPKKYINQYSAQFKRDFLQLLKTAHGEKKVHMNNFYQEYIRDKEHVHMNATKWPSLTEFAKYLGREGVCRVEEGERGLEIQWIDDSAEAIQRREDIKRKDRLAKGDEDLESRLLDQQIKKAREAAERAGKAESPSAQPGVQTTEALESVKVSLSLGSKQASLPPPKEQALDALVPIDSFSSTATSAAVAENPRNETLANGAGAAEAPPPPKMSLSLSGKPKPVNPLMMKKNPLSKRKETASVEPEKRMSNAERIMKEELERKRLAPQRGFGGGKRQRLG